MLLITLLFFSILTVYWARNLPLIVVCESFNSSFKPNYILGGCGLARHGPLSKDKQTFLRKASNQQSSWQFFRRYSYGCSDKYLLARIINKGVVVFRKPTGLRASNEREALLYIFGITSCTLLWISAALLFHAKEYITFTKHEQVHNTRWHKEIIDYGADT